MGHLVFNIDVMLAKRKMSVTELSNKLGLTLANVSILKNGKAKAVKVSTIEQLCRILKCQPGDLMEYVESRKAAGLSAEPTRDDIARVNGELPMKESWKIVETMNLPTDEEMMQGGKNQNNKRFQRDDRKRRN